MSKELPYFRFTVAEWLNGDISMENYECKGLFADVCAWYWFKDCSVTKAMLEKKFSNARLLQILYDSGIIKVIDDFIEIEFLNEQFSVLLNSLEARKAAGSKGGKQKSSNAKAKLKQSSSYKDNNKDNNKDKEIYRQFVHLKITIDEFKKLEEFYYKQTIDSILDAIENYLSRNRINNDE